MLEISELKTREACAKLRWAVGKTCEDHRIKLKEILARDRTRRPSAARAYLAKLLRLSVTPGNGVVWREWSTTAIARVLDRNVGTVRFLLQADAAPEKGGNRDDLRELAKECGVDVALFVRRKEMLTKEQKQKRAAMMRALFQGGWNHSAIARAFGVAPGSVRYQVMPMAKT